MQLEFIICLCRNECSFESFLKLIIVSFRWSEGRTSSLRCLTATACCRWSSATWRLFSTASRSSHVFSSGPLQSYSLSTTMTGSTTYQKVTIRTKVQWRSEYRTFEWQRSVFKWQPFKNRTHSSSVWMPFKIWTICKLDTNWKWSEYRTSHWMIRFWTAVGNRT